jgi:hypothetical protein
MQHQLNAHDTTQFGNRAAKPHNIRPDIAIDGRRLVSAHSAGRARGTDAGEVDDFCGQIISPQCALLYRTVFGLWRLLVRALEPIAERLSPQTHHSAGRTRVPPPRPEPLVLFG